MSLKVSRILHAGYVFECGGTQIVFDPIFENPFSRNCYAYPNVKFDRSQIEKLPISAVFISHFHDDHCSIESLDFLDRETPIYIYCIYDELFELIRQLSFKQVHSLKLRVPIEIGPFKVTPWRALDEDVDSIFQIQADGLNLLNVVDSWIDFDTLDELSCQKPWDMILWPFQTMREIEVIAPRQASREPISIPEEWIRQLKILNPRYIVPSSCQFILESWSWYNQAFFPITYRRFQIEVEAALPLAKVIRLNPSVSVELSHDAINVAEALSWVQPVGAQDVDYEFEPSLTPPSTSEVARHFAALAPEQSERVHSYCKQGLLEKYRTTGASQEPYFSGPRIWQFLVYDQNGRATEYKYRIAGANIELIQDHVEPVGWVTEVIAAKFYAALELGESLTSMYLRINDMNFSFKIEQEIRTVKIVEDPLVRCLFNGIFGAYQMAQLKKLQSAGG